MASSSDRYRPSAILMGSISPMRSATVISGVANFSAYLSSRVIHLRGRSSPCSATAALHSAQIGTNGSQLSSHPSMAGTASSRRSTMFLMSLDFAWPRSPSRMMSCPASMAFSSCGITDSSKPTMPGNRSSPFCILDMRFFRISRLTGTTS